MGSRGAGSEMRSDDERRLAKAILGDQASRRALEERSVGEAPLAAELARQERLWQGLELPPVAAPPPGFARRIARRARSEQRTILPGLGFSPAFSALTAALLVAVGVAGGAGLGSYAFPLDELAPATSVAVPSGSETPVARSVAPPVASTAPDEPVDDASAADGLFADDGLLADSLFATADSATGESVP